jgi:putative ABC transport system permease protein
MGYGKAAGLQFYKQLLERVDSLPGVESASVAFSVPMGYYNSSDFVEVPGYEAPAGASDPSSAFNAVSPGYFRTLGILVLEGRDFSDADKEDSQSVAVVNEAMAKKFWPKESAFGHEFRIAGDRAHSLRVIGVVKNSRTTGMVGPIQE